MKKIISLSILLSLICSPVLASGGTTVKQYNSKGQFSGKFITKGDTTKYYNKKGEYESKYIRQGNKVKKYSHNGNFDGSYSIK